MSNNRFEDEFTVHVVSSASMEIFDSNTLESYRKFFNDKNQLSGDWRVALSEIIFPTKTEKFVNGNLTVHNLKDYEGSQKSSGGNISSRPYSGQKLAFMLVLGTFDTLSQLLATIKRTVGLPNFSFREINSSGKYEILLGKYEGITFPSDKNPRIIGFESITDGNGIHIGYKMYPNENGLMKIDETEAYYGEFLADLCAGKHLIFIYTNIIEYQYVGDTKAPLLRVIDSKQSLKNGSVYELEPTHRIVFTNLDYKKLLTNTIQPISIELRTETGQLVPFSGTAKVILTLQFKKFSQ